MSKRIAHFALDIARKRSVSGRNGGPILIGSQSKAHKSSPPPAPVGLRGVAVVQRDECAAAIFHISESPFGGGTGNSGDLDGNSE